MVSVNSRTLLPSLALGIPALAWTLVATVILISALTGYRPLAAPRDLTLSEAAAIRDPLEILRQIRSGADPNKPERVRRDLLKSDEYTMTPLEAAVAVRRLEIFQLLQKHGAVVGVANLPTLLCFAEQERATDIATYVKASEGNEISCAGVHMPW